MARFKRFIFSIVFVLALGLPVWAGSALAAEAEPSAKEDPLRIELERLKKERQKALDRARGKAQGKTRDGRPKGKRRSWARWRPAPDRSGRLSLSLPPGWKGRETEDAKTRAWAEDVALGDTSPWSKNRIGTKLYLPGDEVSGGAREIILVEQFRKRRSMTLSDAYRRWRGKVLAGCDGAAPSAVPVPRQGEENGFEVIESFYVCPKRKAENTASISLLKAMAGAEGLTVINRVRREPLLESGETTSPEAVSEAVLEDWRVWARGITLVDVSSAGAAPAGEKASEKVSDRGGGADAVSKGYGFFVNRQGHVLTVHHLVTGCRRLRFSSQAAALQVNDPVKGLALFKLRRKPEQVAVFRAGAGVKIGDPVVLTSYPPDGGLATDFSVSTGVLSARVGPGGDPRQISVTVPIPPGNSGIPLVDLFGTVAGIALDTAEALKMAGERPGGPAVNADRGGNFAIGAGTLRRFLDGLGVSYETSDTDEILSPGDAARRARDVTVFVECWK